MAKLFSSKIIIGLSVILFLFTLFLNLSDNLNAQDSNRTFIDFLKSHVNSEITIASQRGNTYTPNDIALLKEVGKDYIIVEIKPIQTVSAFTEAIPIQSIYSITLGARIEIHLNR